MLNIDGNRILMDDEDKDLSPHKDSLTANQLEKNDDIVNMNAPSDLKEVLVDLNKDEIEDVKSRMSSIDMRTRLSSIESSASTAWETLGRMNFIALNALSLPRQKKRNNVSLDGKGRTEYVEITQNQRTFEQGKGLMSQIQEKVGLK